MLGRWPPGQHQGAADPRGTGAAWPEPTAGAQRTFAESWVSASSGSPPLALNGRTSLGGPIYHMLAPPLLLSCSLVPN